MILSPGQCRAARGLLNWTQEDLAQAANVSRSTVRDFEGNRHCLHRTTEAQLVAAFENAGVVLLPSDDLGPGVRFAAG